MEKAKNIELILINISGQDRPGVTSALTEILAKYEADILDIGQADIHHTLSLGILFKTDSSRSGEILKELLFKASGIGGEHSIFSGCNRRPRHGSDCRERIAM